MSYTTELIEGSLPLTVNRAGGKRSAEANSYLLLVSIFSSLFLNVLLPLAAYHDLGYDMAQRNKFHRILLASRPANKGSGNHNEDVGQ